MALSVAQLVERWTVVVTLARLVIHRSLVRFRSERFLLIFHSTPKQRMNVKEVCVHRVDMHLVRPSTTTDCTVLIIVGLSI